MSAILPNCVRVGQVIVASVAKGGKREEGLTGNINDANVNTYALNVHTPSVAPIFNPSATYPNRSATIPPHQNEKH
jgi:hypothetical protein